jgi:ribosomal protein S18 acetylase RimI-like enzyme
MTQVNRLGAEEAPEVIDVLCESFYDYPVMRYVIGEADDYGRRLHQLVTLFVMARVYRGETALGIPRERGGGLLGVATISDPRIDLSPPETADLREQVWAALGEEARARYSAFGQATTPFEQVPPHLHLNMIGTRTEARGRGLGGRLLDAVHEISTEDPGSTGVTLTTEVAGNVALYRRFGYDVVGSARVGGPGEGEGFTTWGMYRPDRPAGPSSPEQ